MGEEVVHVAGDRGPFLAHHPTRSWPPGPPVRELIRCGAPRASGRRCGRRVPTGRRWRPRCCAPGPGGARQGPHPQHPAVCLGARTDRGPHSASGCTPWDRGGHRPGPGYLEVLPPLPDPLRPPCCPRPPEVGLEMGEVPRRRVWVQRGSGRGRLAADRRARAVPSAHNCPGPEQRHVYDPPHGQGAGQGAGPAGPAHPPLQHRPHHRSAAACCSGGPDEGGADEKPPCAQAATQGPRPTRHPHRANRRCGPGWKASGGAAAPATETSPPVAPTVAGTAHDEHPHPAPAARGQTRRRLPPAHPHHPRHIEGTAIRAAEISFPGLGPGRKLGTRENLSSSVTLSRWKGHSYGSACPLKPS